MEPQGLLRVKLSLKQMLLARTEAAPIHTPLAGPQAPRLHDCASRVVPMRGPPCLVRAASLKALLQSLAHSSC